MVDFKGTLPDPRMSLVACMRLYDPLCLLVGRLVGLSVCLSRLAFFVALRHLKLFKVILS